ncbi:MAG: hypothetical protein K6T87_16070 [Roseiflexus sp.]|uniref:hypothetical protein n=1 Tax=Roseiflexus sp. TaxID=2562120 RepID=UPI0025E74062|nr:hypothetical protein [Roseiflexus sp.]MCL6542073.1 hypothetical protein [Roseiflexus sp.]
MNNRKKGIKSVNVIKKVLLEIGHLVDGPFNKVTFFRGRKVISHVDLFGAYDLISIDKKTGLVFFHQITSINAKTRKIKKMSQIPVYSFLWCKNKDKKFRLFLIKKSRNKVEELTI